MAAGEFEYAVPSLARILPWVVSRPREYPSVVELEVRIRLALAECLAHTRNPVRKMLALRESFKAFDETMSIAEHLPDRDLASRLTADTAECELRALLRLNSKSPEAKARIKVVLGRLRAWAPNWGDDTLSACVDELLVAPLAPEADQLAGLLIDRIFLDYRAVDELQLRRINLLLRAADPWPETLEAEISSILSQVSTEQTVAVDEALKHYAQELLGRRFDSDVEKRLDWVVSAIRRPNVAAAILVRWGQLLMVYSDHTQETKARISAILHRAYVKFETEDDGHKPFDYAVCCSLQAYHDSSFTGHNPKVLRSILSRAGELMDLKRSGDDRLGEIYSHLNRAIVVLEQQGGLPNWFRLRKLRLEASKLELKLQ
jgi:hypothetical protein